MRGAMDAFVKSKLVAAAEQPAGESAPSVTTAEAGETSAEVPPDLQPAEKAQATEAPQTPARPVEVAPDPELNIDPKVVKSVSGRVRGVLKMLVDPNTNLPVAGNTRKEIVDNYFVGKAVRDSGVPVASLREYLSVAPTVDVLRNVSQNASLHEKMLSDYASDPSSFAEQLYATDQEAFQNLVQSLTDPDWLQATFSKNFAAVAKAGTKNYLENAYAEAQRSGDADLEAAVGKLMEWGGLASPPQAQAAPTQQTVDPAQERIRQLEEERAQFFSERQNSFVNSAYQRAASTVATRIEGVVTEAAADSPFNEKTQGRIKTEIGHKLYAAVTQNEHVIRTLRTLVNQGPGDQSHLDRVATYLQSQALALLPSVSREVIEEYSDLVGPAVAQREQRVQKVLSQRAPVGASGRPTAPPAEVFDPKKFGNMREAFDAFARHRLGG